MKSGFAGSLVVSAGWKGRNLRRGMQDSQKRVRNFGKGIRRIVAVTALGVGAFAAAKGIRSLLMMSSVGAKAISKWSMAWAQFKTQVSRLVAGPASQVIDWLVSGLAAITEWLSKQMSIGEALRNARDFIVKIAGLGWDLVKSGAEVAAKWALNTGVIEGLIGISNKLFAIWNNPVQSLFLDTGIFDQFLALSIKIHTLWKGIADWILQAVRNISGIFGSGAGGAATAVSGVQTASNALMASQPQPAGAI
jgi:hypothetical protein